MKKLQHNFELLGKSILEFKHLSYIPSHAICSFCGLDGYTAFREISKNEINNESDSHKQLLKELELCNKYCTCLTEEEYFIKQIIE